MKSESDHDLDASVPTPLWLCAALFIATLLMQLPFFDRWYSDMDEGHVLMFADIVARGGDIYRDATIYPLPGAFYLLAGAFEIFGPSVILSRWIIALAFSGFVVLGFVWLRRLLPLPGAIVGVAGLWLYRVWAFPHWQIYSYSTIGLLFLMGCMIAVLAWFRGRDLRSLMLAGLLFGCGVACKQDYGAAALLAVGLALVIDARTDPDPHRPGSAKTLAAFVLPGAAVGAAMGLYFWMQGILPDLLQMTVLNHMRGLASFDYPSIPSLFPFFGQDERLRTLTGIWSYFPGIVLTTVEIDGLRATPIYRDTPIYEMLVKSFFYAPYAIVAWGVVRFGSRRDRLAVAGAGRDRALAELLLLCLAFGFLLVLTVNKPQDWLHFAVLYWPFLFLVLVFAASALQGRRALGWVLAAVLALPGLSLVGTSVHLMSRLRDAHPVRVEGERGGFYAKPEAARLLAEVVAYVQAHSEPDERVAVIPYFPMAQFLMDRLGPHRSSYIVWPVPEFPDRDARIVRAMQQQDVQLVMYNFTQIPNFERMSDFAPELFAYVVDHYRLDHLFHVDEAGYMMGAARRESAPPPGDPVFESAMISGALRIEPGTAPPIALSPDERPGVVADALWPFRPVVALRPTQEVGRSVYSFAFEVPKRARLVTAIGVEPREWFVYPSYATSFELSILDASGRREVVYSRTLTPHTVFADRGWHEIDVVLDAYAGQSVTVELATSTQAARGESIWGGGWAQPRLVRLDANRGDAP